MSSYSHLCCGLRRVIYPSFQEETFSHKGQTIADAVYRVPLLWLCLFRLEDLVEQEVNFGSGHGETPAGRVRAPVVDRRIVGQRLEVAVPRVEALFPGCGSLQEHAGKLREAIDLIDEAYPFVTIEYQEVAEVAGCERWDAIIQRSLEYLSGRDISDARERLLEVADLEDVRRFVPIDRYLRGDNIGKEDWILLDALLGAESPRSVPWLPQRLPAEPLSELLTAIAQEQGERVADLLQAGADPNSSDPNSGETALEIAVSRWSWAGDLPPENLKIIEALMAAGAQMTDASLACAAKFVTFSQFQRMFTQHSNPNACDRLGRTALHFACESSQSAIDKARLLLDAGADVNRRTPMHYSVLSSAFAANNLELARLLFERGLDSHAADEVLVASKSKGHRRRGNIDDWLELLRAHRTKLV